MTNLAVDAALTRAPANWTRTRFKAVLERKDDRREESEAQLLSLSSSGHLYPRTEANDRQQASEENLARCLVVNPDELVVNPMWLTGGSVAVSHISGAVSPDYRVFAPREGVHPRFIHHLLRSEQYMDQYKLFTRADTTFDRRVQQNDLDQLPVALPTMAAQARIADFLDDQTTRIDNIINARRQQIGAIDESRLHLFGEAATSIWGASQVRSVPWFPVHRQGWGLVRLTWIAECLDGRRVPLSAEVREGRQGEHPYFGASAIVDYVDDFLFDERLVLVGEDGGALSNPRFDVVQEVSGKVWVNNHAHVLRPLGVSQSFLAAMLRGVDRELLISGATRPKITQEDLMNIRVPLPPPSDRELMMAALSALEKAWDEGKRSLQRSVDLHQEFKRSLISAAVSGEFDVSAACGRGVPA